MGSAVPACIADTVAEHSKRVRSSVAPLLIVFLASFVFLFCGMSLRPGMYDEAIMLTGAMRVAAGQVPHRDFYFIYGPAELYMLAGVFKLFGTSLLAERLVDLSIKASVVTAVFALLSAYGRRSVAVVISIITILWLFAMSEFGLAITPVSFLNLAGSALLLPVFAGRVPKRRMLAAGAMAGSALLFRYDTGIALPGVHLCAIAIAIALRCKGMGNRLRTFAGTCWPYLLGFAALTIPLALYDWSIASIAPLVHDIILFPSKYYYRGRNLPFPGINLRGLENLEIYLPVAIAAVSLYCLTTRRTQPGDQDQDNVAGERPWQGVVITFTLLLVVMYLKGVVRVSLVQMYLAILPSLVLIGVLFQRRFLFALPVRMLISSLLSLCALTAVWSSLHEIRLQQLQHSSMLQNIGPASATQAAWCKTRNTLTRGICFLPEDDRMLTTEYILSHTQPGQLLYVGVNHHDRIVANDNLIYFATQRLPATHWSHFDPGLQNRYDIQTQMVHELTQSAPPYVVVDAEFELAREPNDSARSSGVTILDAYLHKQYQSVATFGAMSIWRRL